MTIQSETNSQPTYLVSYPKSGSTWLRFLLANCISDQSCDFTNVHTLIPDLHFTPTCSEAESQTGILKTHLSYQPGFRRVVYLVRDGRDVAVSYFYHWQKQQGGKPLGSFRAFLERFNNGELDSFGRWGEHVLSWVDGGTRDLLLVRYEDLKFDTVGELRRVLAFLGTPVTEETLLSAVRRSEFKRMQELEREQHHLCPTLAHTDPSIPFIRSGRNAQFVEMFMPESRLAFERIHGQALMRLGYLSGDSTFQNPAPVASVESRQSDADPDLHRPVEMQHAGIGATCENVSGVRSPVTGSNRVEKRKEIDTRFVARLYQEHFGIDVSRYFAGVSRIDVYRCLDTGYQFYFPLTLEGDSSFYEALESIPWYYMDWKREHEIALEHIRRADRVLEVGCARGAFLTNLKTSGVDCTGLELNRNAAAIGREHDVTVVEESIQEHASRHPETYDVVCFFQVLEHVSDVRSFMEAAVGLLRPDGRICIGVPNYDSFIGLDEANPLEMPPHHVGMWTESALAKLADVLGLDVVSIECESLAPYHIDYFANIAKKRIANVGTLHDTLHGLARTSHVELKGHTVVAVFRKGTPQ